MPRLRHDEGQAIVEYGMILAGVTLVLFGFFVVSGLDDVFIALVDKIEAAFG
jgi:Flp pilus assembly pilin Flp